MATPTTVKLHPPTRSNPPVRSPPPRLPTLLKTPSGLAILELQGTINLHDTAAGDHQDTIDGSESLPIPVGYLEFPDFAPGTDDSAWMKRVFMYVGQHQRLTGEVKKLPKALAVVRRRGAEAGDGEDTAEELEVVEVVKYKLVFLQRPEPVGST